MIYRRPLRLTTLHFAQRLRIEDETFIKYLSFVYIDSPQPAAEVSIIPVLALSVQSGLYHRQDLRFALRNGDRVLIVSG